MNGTSCDDDDGDDDDDEDISDSVHRSVNGTSSDGDDGADDDGWMYSCMLIIDYVKRR